MRHLEPAGLPGPHVDGGQHDGRLGAASTTTLPPAHRRRRERLRGVEVSPLELEACGGTVQVAVGVGGGGLPQGSGRGDRNQPLTFTVSTTASYTLQVNGVVLLQWGPVVVTGISGSTPGS